MSWCLSLKSSSLSSSPSPFLSSPSPSSSSTSPLSPSPSPSSSSRSASISSYMIRCRQDWGRAVFLIFRSSHQGCQCTAANSAYRIHHQYHELPHNTSALLLWKEGIPPGLPVHCWGNSAYRIYHPCSIRVIYTTRILQVYSGIDLYTSILLPHNSVVR